MPRGRKNPPHEVEVQCTDAAAVIDNPLPADGQVEAARAGRSAPIGLKTEDSPPLSDAALLEQCLKSDADAWEQLYHRCQPGLLQSIKAVLAKAGANRDLADEVAAQVWHVLLDNDAQLLSSFDIARGCRLSTYFNVIASKVALQYLRTSRRQRNRDLHAGKSIVDTNQVSGTRLLVELKEFLATLTPREQSFCQSYLLLDDSENGRSPLTQANVWQLSHRVRQKLESFIESQ